MPLQHPDTLPFTLPERAEVRRIRKVNGASPTESTQRLTGFDDRFTDIVDYIVRITDEIWQDRAIGLIYNTYEAECAVYTSYGVTRGAEAVVRNTVASINLAPDAMTHHLNVAWCGDDDRGFYTAHLGFDDGTDRAAGLYGQATGRRYLVRFAADCVSRNNKIHTEWLVRDNGAVVRQLGLNVNEVARQVAERPIAEPYVLSAPVLGSKVDQPDLNSLEQWVDSLFEGVYNRRRLDLLASFYAHNAIVHSGGGRTLQGLPAISALVLAVLAAIPDGVMTVEHVCWSEETDGCIVAVRWVLAGSSARGGILGNELPIGRPVYMMGCSHLRLEGSRIVEEWTVFDELAVLAMAYRA